MGSDLKGFDVEATGGVMIEARDAFTRPADTTAYTAADVLAKTTSSTATEPLPGLVVAREAGGGGYLVGWSLSISGTGMTPRVRVHLYNTAQPATALNGDNGAFVELDANQYNFVASFDLPALALNAGAGADMTRAVRDDLRIPFVCADGDRKLYYRYQVLDADTPAASTWHRTVVKVDAN
jgi:hypothetical protein